MPKKKKARKKQLFSHHRHTGKVLPHHHTSYPLIALLLLMVGVFLGHITLRARADTVTVTASANGPLPPSPAIILDPTEGEVFTEIPIEVSGTCPATYFVKLFRNNTFSGSAPCSSGGTFVIQTDLFRGLNELRARIYNAADQEGPASVPVNVSYSPPDPPPTQPSAPSSPGETPAPSTPTSPPQEQPFLISTETFFKATFPNQKITWEFDIIGGDDPFEVAVTWGDGETSTIHDLHEGHFAVDHVYSRDPDGREYFPVHVSVTDAVERKATLQVFSVLSDRTIPGFGGGSGSGSDDAGGSSQPGLAEDLLKRLLVLWPAYGITILMAVSFWLGEQQLALVWLHRPLNPFKPHRPKGIKRRR